MFSIETFTAVRESYLLSNQAAHPKHLFRDALHREMLLEELRDLALIGVFSRVVVLCAGVDGG